jgi:hypothetical protein
MAQEPGFCTKHRHRTRQEAQEHRASYNARRMNKGGRVYVYKCQKCDFFHIGHKVEESERPLGRRKAREKILREFEEQDSEV